MLYARVVFFGGVAAMAFAGGHGRPPEASFVHCYRLAWSSFVDVEAARGCGVSAELTPPRALDLVPRGLALST